MTSDNCTYTIKKNKYWKNEKKKKSKLKNQIIFIREKKCVRNTQKPKKKNQ